MNNGPTTPGAEVSSLRCIITEDQVLALLTHEAQLFRHVQNRLVRGLSRQRVAGIYARGSVYRRLDRVLQKLRRAGKAKYLRKADGGPGWVRVQA